MSRAVFATNFSNIEAKKKEIKICSSQHSYVMNLLIATFFPVGSSKWKRRKSLIGVNRMHFSNDLDNLSKQSSYSHKQPTSEFDKALIFINRVLL